MSDQRKAGRRWSRGGGVEGKSWSKTTQHEHPLELSYNHVTETHAAYFLISQNTLCFRNFVETGSVQDQTPDWMNSKIIF